MAHFLTLSLAVLAAWTLLALPLGVFVGRRLRAVRRATHTRSTSRSSR